MKKEVQVHKDLKVQLDHLVPLEVMEQKGAMDHLAKQDHLECLADQDPRVKKDSLAGTVSRVFQDCQEDLVTNQLILGNLYSISCALGVPGIRGLDGLPGQKGGKGEKGLPGFPGQSGQLGNPGSSGLPGLKGDVGPPGPTGRAGLPGSPGMKGDEGRDGPRVNALNKQRLQINS